MDSRYVSPPHWTDSELESARQNSTADFVRERLSEGAERYQPALASCLNAVRALFDATSYLRDLPAGTVFASQPALVTPARYLGGPPISADDLNVLADRSVADRKRLDAHLAQVAASVIEAALDRDRFPWLFENPVREPTAEELEIAVRWTAGLWAAQLVQTQRRGEAAARQEAAVAQVLEEAGFQRVQVEEIDFTARNISPGQYCRETKVVGAKCDVPVMLRDGRLLLIECKVSNSGLNSIKRLIRETCGKAAHWRSRFGDRAITAAVLSGVFNLRHLQEAQNIHGVSISWERDLSPLASFVRAAR